MTPKILRGINSKKNYNNANRSSNPKYDFNYNQNQMNNSTQFNQKLKNPVPGNSFQVNEDESV